jgi:peptidoglycan/LPS O-acetylase OafA/YrhL
MFFYVLFPFLLLLQKKQLKVFVVLTVILYVLAQYFHLRYYPERHSLSDNIVDTVFFNPVMHISQFMIGMVGAFIYGMIKNKALKLTWVPLVLFLIIVILITERPENISYHVGLIAPVFMFFIISVAVYQPKFLTLKPLVYLGEISYGIYILQQPVWKFFGNINTRHIHIPDQIFFWIALGLLVCIASLSYTYIEVPLKRKISNLGVKQR